MTKGRSLTARRRPMTQGAADGSFDGRFNFEDSQLVRELPDITHDPSVLIASQAVLHGVHVAVIERSLFLAAIACGQLTLALGYGW